MDFLPKGFIRGFGPKNGHFSHFFFLGNIGQKNIVNDILERKNAFLGYKNMILVQRYSRTKKRISRL